MLRAGKAAGGFVAAGEDDFVGGDAAAAGELDLQTACCVRDADGFAFEGVNLSGGEPADGLGVMEGEAAEVVAVDLARHEGR